jgi:hypothetical protein
MKTLLIYIAAGVVYISIGVFWVDFMFSVVVAAGYLLVAVWLIPSAIGRRLR